MLILTEDHIKDLGVDWNKTISVISDTVRCLAENDFAQPIKPYLRYRNLKNRIIAMPAFVGGNINMAGIKWIASFPENIDRGIPRAHSVVVLNDADSGQPVGIICTPLLSIIRTASVSGWVVDHFVRARRKDKITIGITGFGPIGQWHLKMCLALFGDRISKVILYDVRKISSSLAEGNSVVEIAESWESAYSDSDIFITCTVASAPYIDRPPKAGSLHVNVSLRDYKTIAYEWFKDALIVDNWEEVCRERTDIEMMHIEKGLAKEDTLSITDLANEDCFERYDAATPIMFNPMGMAVFDIAIGNHYYLLASSR